MLASAFSLTCFLVYPEYLQKDVIFVGICLNSNCGNQWKIVLYYENKEVNIIALMSLIVAASRCWQEV